MKVRIVSPVADARAEGPPNQVQDSLGARLPGPPGPSGLQCLDDAPLSAAAHARLSGWLQDVRGEPHWRTRKAVELRELVVLEERSPRLEVLHVDARTELLVRLSMRVPVPCKPPTPAASAVVAEAEREEGALRRALPRFSRLRFDPAALGGGVRIHHEARVSLRYPAEFLRGPIQGQALAAIEGPAHVLHPNVGSMPDQRVCLGHSLPRGLPLRELVLMTYAALSMQAVELPSGEAGPMMNGAALVYWRMHAACVPLTNDTLFTDLVTGAEASP
jgi:hypothetical protein